MLQCRKIGTSKDEKGEVIFGEIKPRISWIKEDVNSLIVSASKVLSKVIKKSVHLYRHTVQKQRDMQNS